MTSELGEQLPLLLEATPSGMILVDDKGRMVLVNRLAEQIFGYERGELVGQSVEVLIPVRHAEHHAGQRSEYFEHLTGRPMGSGRDLSGLRKDGSEVAVEVGLNPLHTDQGTYVLCAVVDITDRKLTQVILERQRDALHERESRLQAILSSIGDGVLTTDVDGRVSYLNPVAEALTGWTGGEAVGQAVEEVLDLFSAEGNRLDSPTHRREASRALSPLPEGTVLISRRGTSTPVAGNVTAIADGDQVLGAVVVFQDISERRILQRQIEFADQLVILGTMTAGLAHELNTPLQVLMLSLGQALESLADLEPPSDGDGHGRWQALGHAVGDSQRVTQTVVDIVADLEVLSHPKERASGSCQVSQAVDKALRLVPRNLRGVAAITRSEVETPDVAISLTKLTQVILNLVVNAAHSLENVSSEGGIGITTRSEG